MIMKRIFKCLSIISVVLCVALTAVVSYNAASDTQYISDGFTYTITDYGTASICGWDDSSSDLVIPNKVGDKFVTDIASFGMRNNKFITSLDVSAPTKFDTIGTYAFEGCSSLSGQLLLPRKIGFIGDAAFKDCSSIESIDYRANTDSISEKCFSGCSALKNIEIMAGPKKIEAYAFENCSALEGITIPKTVKSIDDSAFSGCGDFTVYCYHDSCALQYAKDKGINFVLLDPKLGDVNLDGVININDVTYIQMHDVQLITLGELEKKAADVNRDGEITIRDATLIQMYLANIITEF